MKAQELIAFLETFAAAKAKQPVDSAGGDQAKQRKQKELPKVYKELTLSEFEGLQEKEDAWLVAFSAGGTATRVWQSGSPHCWLLLRVTMQLRLRAHCQFHRQLAPRPPCLQR